MTATFEPEPTTTTGEPDEQAFRALVGRLNRQSVDKHYDAYADIDWDAHPVEPSDPRWELGPDDLLGRTSWYRQQPLEVRSAIGLHLVVAKAKTGLVFEQILQRGLLDFAGSLPNGAPEFRYIVHEVIEEGHHTLMFQELVNRSGYDVPGLGFPESIGARLVVAAARPMPALFLFFVLGGEDPIDHVQREALRSGDAHPLLERIMRIHVTEEARHLSFARHWLRHNVPLLPAWRRFALAHAVPVILGEMSKMMLRPSAHVVDLHRIPADVVAEAYDNDEARTRAAAAVRKVRSLCHELDLMPPSARWLWRRAGLGGPSDAPAT